MPATLRHAAALGLAAALLNLLVAPFHGAAYFATADGGEDLLPHQRAWGEALRGALPGAFAFDDPYGVYLAYGKLTAVAVALYAAAMVALVLARPRRAGGLGKATAAAWSLFALLAAAEYFTPFTDQVFLALVPVLLATLVLTGLLGRKLARGGGTPRLFAHALLGGAVAFVPVVIVAGHIPFGLLGLGAAWGLLVALGLRRVAKGPQPVAEA